MQNSCLAMMLNVVLWGRSESDLIFSSGMSVHYVWLLFWLQVARYFSSLMLFWPILSANGSLGSCVLVLIILQS